MNLEELQLQADKDLKINDVELDIESLKTPQLHNKYLKHLNNFKLLLSNHKRIIILLKEKSGSIILVKQTLKYMLKNHLT